MPAHLVDPPPLDLRLHPRLAGITIPAVARIVLLNYVAERSVILEPMSPEDLLIRVFAPPHPRLVLATDPARQRAYLQLFLGAIAISDRDIEDPAESIQIVSCLSWLARLVDQAIR
jgi:hypothetical protein